MKPAARNLVIFGLAACVIAGVVIWCIGTRPASAPNPTTTVPPPPAPAPLPVQSAQVTEAFATLADTKATDTVRTRALSRLLREKAPGLDDALLKVLDAPAESPGFQAVALQHLGMVAKTVPPDSQSRSRIVTRMQSYLDGNDVTMRRLALQALCQLKHESGAQAAVKWLNDDSKEANRVRDMAIYCIRDLGLKDQIPVIRKHARDGNDVIRMAALTVLAEWHDVESLDAMKEAAEAGSPALRKVGKEAVEKIGNR